MGAKHKTMTDKDKLLDYTDPVPSTSETGWKSLKPKWFTLLKKGVIIKKTILWYKMHVCIYVCKNKKNGVLMDKPVVQLSVPIY